MPGITDCDYSQICQRCGRATTLDHTYDWHECPNCGPMRWRWLQEYKYEKPLVRLFIAGGYFPLTPREETGYFIDNPNPLIGYREPAKVWVERTK